MKLPRQCAILVGGLGTRLGPLTAETPKPLLDCGGRPFLAWVLRELVRFGIEDVVLLAGYRSERVEQFVADLARWVPKPLACRVSVEPSPAGTAGALWYARDQLDDTFLMMNGDSWLDTNLARFFASAAAAAPDAIGTVLLRSMEECSRYGTAEVRDGRLVAFREQGAASGPGLIGAGMYIFEKRLLERFAPPSSLEKDVLPALARQGELAASVLDGYFIDIGVPADYARAQHELPQRLQRPAVFFDRDGVLNENLGWVGTLDRFHWLPGAKEALRRVTDVGAHVFVVTNQAGVARGFYTEEDVHALQRHIEQDLLAAGATIDDFRFCPYHPEGAVERYRRESDWRKPGPGMLLDLLRAWNVDPERTLLVGDMESDMGAAKAAHIEGHWYRGGDLLEFVEPLLARLKERSASPGP
ncbi:MAG: HAD-IIIA family hydrolase [Acidobacteriaceae bacterium]